MVSRALKRLRRKMTIEVLWIYVANVLLRRGDAKAYDIKKMVEKVFGFRPSTITVYRVVYRMVNEGLLEKRIVDGETVYRLTERGREEYLKAVEFLESIVSTLKES